MYLLFDLKTVFRYETQVMLPGICSID